MPKLDTFKKKLQWFFILNLGMLITAAGISIFKNPNHFAMGGTSGIAIILTYFFPNISASQFMYIINIVLVLLGFIFVGKGFAWATVYASMILSVFVSFFDYILPLSAPLTDDMFLEMVWAVILPAVGSAIAFNIGASTGGTDIVAMILAKHTSLEIGKALLVSDILITFATFPLYGAKVGLYCVLGLILKTFLVDIVVDGINSRKYVTVISREHEKIRSFILTNLKRGATLSRAEGAYSHEAETVVSTALTRRQAVLLRNYIKTVDKHAFITIVNSSEIIGKGFREI